MLYPKELSGQTLSGQVSGRTQSLPGAVIRLEPGNYLAVTDAKGHFEISPIPSGRYQIVVTFMGYGKHSDSIDIVQQENIFITLSPQTVNLQEVLVSDHLAEQRKRETPLNIEIVNDDYIRQNMAGSLMQSLARLPGVGAVEIGSGQSKPAIRGLGFNRVVVVENSIKHEGQQWGNDHGLEIDQFAANRVEIIKGPSSLMYGSDAIGGVIKISRLDIPAPHTTGGTADFVFAGNNMLLGTSGYAFTRREKLFFSARATLTHYADYRVPADSIDIYSYRAALSNNRMRNTAGKEQNMHFTVGYIQNGFSTQILASAIKSENGFFANAHGLEPRRVDTLLHDKSNRDIQYPKHKVEHLKLISKSNLTQTNSAFDLNLGIQRNRRQELSPYVSHGYMPANFPTNIGFEPEIERAFEKHIYSANALAHLNTTGRTNISLGINNEYQINRIDGRGFIIPEFEQYLAGIFATAKYQHTLATILHAGLRADYGAIRIDEYSDWYTTPAEEHGEEAYAQRAANLSRHFHSFTWAIGANHNISGLSLKINAGKSFRMPTPKELSANGVNYHRFSYEKGDSTLSPETAYQLDAGIEWNTYRFAMGITPYINYFPNYIYLNPDFRHNHLYGNGNQIFNYTQSSVFRHGAEIHSHFNVSRNFTLGAIAEYVYAQQLSGDKRGFGLPFSPPPMLLLSAKYVNKSRQWLSNSYLSADIKMVAAQNRIVPPEKKTPAYHTINLSAGGILSLNKYPLSVSIQIHNLMNTKYFNHTSYYRIINVPEPGRNLIVNLQIPINREITQTNHSH